MSRFQDICLHKSNIKSVIPMIERIANQTEKRLRLTIKIWRDKRSLDQNSLLWMWYEEIARQIDRKTGERYSPEDLHEFYKSLYCPVTEREVMGKTIYIKSTAALDKEQFCFYMRKIEVDVYTKGMKLTIPEECEYQHLKDKQESN